jgi:DNA polymerase-3 subunit beta
VNLNLDGDRMIVKAGKSRFVLTTLPASDFPTVEEINPQQTFELEQVALRKLLDKTHFSMAQQDVRYYLNGMLLETDGKMLRTVATDGHRLALCEMELGTARTGTHQVIVPRKGVLELQRLMGEEGTVGVQVGTNHVRVQLGDIRFTSKLIDGRFPEYGRVIPARPTRTVKADRDALRRALQRTSILSNEKYRGIRLALKTNVLTITAHNPEQEEAEEEIEVSYDGEEMEVGFNVNYLLDALGAVDGAEVEVGLTDSNSSCLVRAPGGGNAKYVVMPMRL